MARDSKESRRGIDRASVGGALGALIGVPVWDRFGIVAGLAVIVVLGVGLRLILARTTRT